MIRRFKFSFVLVLLILCTVAFFVGGCSDGNTKNPAPEESNESGEQITNRSDWPRQIDIGSGPLGGAYHVMCTGWAGMISSELGVQTVAEVTGATVDNIKLLQRGDMTFGLSTVGGAYEGYNGIGWAEEEGEFDKIRATFPSHPSYLHGWGLKGSNIETIYDLEGKAVNFAPRGSNVDVMARRLLEFLEIEPSTFVNTNFNDANDLMKDGNLDASFCTSGLPLPAIIDIERSHDVVVFGVTKDDGDRFAEKYPWFIVEEIPEETYEALNEPIYGLVDWNTMLTSKDIPEDLVYEITKVSLENPEKMKAIHNAFENAKTENALYLEAIPFHVGAIRYYEEMGIELPESVYPPEYKK